MSSHIEEVQRVVVCAANRYADNIVCGARHFDNIMRGQIKIFQDTLEGTSHYGAEWEQGFIDQFGVFMDRKEALFVASTAGQINIRRTKTFPLDELFSEDIY